MDSLWHVGGLAGVQHGHDGVIGGLLLLATYFVTELLHYDVFKFLKNDPAEWKREWPLVAVGVIGAPLCLWPFGFR
jgi:hypothetical protein